jgi:hypothetical protein
MSRIHESRYADARDYAGYLWFSPVPSDKGGGVDRYV